MIQSISQIQAARQNKNAPYFVAKFEYEQSVYRPLKETADAIAKFNAKTDSNFDVETYLLKLKEDFEKATENIIGTVKISADGIFEGINASFRDNNGKVILSSIPALRLFKKSEPAHEVIINTLKNRYEKLFEATLLPKSNPFKD